MSSILNATEIEMELPFAAFYRIRGACSASGGKMVMYQDSRPDFEGYTIVGPPRDVLSLIPGLYERYAKEARDEVNFTHARRLQNIAYDPAWRQQQAMMCMAQQMNPSPLGSILDQSQMQANLEAQRAIGTLGGQLVSAGNPMRQCLGDPYARGGLLGR